MPYLAFTHLFIAWPFCQPQASLPATFHAQLVDAFARYTNLTKTTLSAAMALPGMNTRRHLRPDRRARIAVDRRTAPIPRHGSSNTPRIATWLMCIVAILIEVWVIVKGTLQFLSFLPIPLALSFDCLGILCTIVIVRTQTRRRHTPRRV